MRIVIDLLGAQIALEDNRSDIYLSEILQWISNNDIENYQFILHSKHSDTSTILRNKLKNTKTFFYAADNSTLENKKLNVIYIVS